MDNVARIVLSGACTGCGACGLCPHIRFEQNALGFPSPVIDAQCKQCGQCVRACIYDSLRAEEDDE